MNDRSLLFCTTRTEVVPDENGVDLDMREEKLVLFSRLFSAEESKGDFKKRVMKI